MIEGTLQQQHYSFNDNGEGDAHLIISLVETCLACCLSSLDSIIGTEVIVAKIGFTSFAMSWLGVDASGEPVTPVYTYARRNDNSDISVNALRYEHIACFSL